MIISYLMTSDVETAAPSDSLKMAASIMEENDLDALPICENGRLVGMLTIQDIAINALAYWRSPEQTKVSQCMTFEAKYVFADQSSAYAMHVMLEQQLKNLLVLNRDYELLGSVSFDDVVVATKVSEAFTLQAKASAQMEPYQLSGHTRHSHPQNYPYHAQA